MEPVALATEGELGLLVRRDLVGDRAIRADANTHVNS
jgi:hypothetical protein